MITIDGRESSDQEVTNIVGKRLQSVGRFGGSVDDLVPLFPLSFVSDWKVIYLLKSSGRSVVSSSILCRRNT